MAEPDEVLHEDELASELADSSTSAYKVKLEVFEGPLDLLLHLIKKEQVSIYDIPIARITEQYLEYLSLMQEMDIAIAGDFLVMAATLIYIKTKMLLPRNPLAEEEGEEEDPRQQLVQQLLEYQKYKAAAEMLWSKAEVEQAVFTRPPLQIEESELEVAATVYDLFEAFRRTMERLKEKIAMEIEREEITMAEKITEIRQRLELADKLDVSELFERAQSKQELITIFLALLELVKQSVIRLVQRMAFDQILAMKVSDQPGSEAAI
ncbi:MAG: segregation/condensation protein A [Acidobacteria bacterium]|nr:segregation/condensation protein A [Acidobacteriota bacterium]